MRLHLQSGAPALKLERRMRFNQLVCKAIYSIQPKECTIDQYLYVGRVGRREIIGMALELQMKMFFSKHNVGQMPCSQFCFLLNKIKFFSEIILYCLPGFCAASYFSNSSYYSSSPFGRLSIKKLMIFQKKYRLSSVDNHNIIKK